MTGKIVKNIASNILKNKGNNSKKSFAAICVAALFLVLVIGVVIIVVVGAMWPIFLVMTIVGGDTVYGNSASDVPSELTIEGIETWTEEERKMFNILEEENKYYNDDFKYYKAGNILVDPKEKLAISAPIATVSHQGTVNLESFDDEFNEEMFENISFDYEYDGEKHVYSTETRDFYKEAGKRMGNSFMIFPGMRMLLGYLVSTDVTFFPVEYKIYWDKCEYHYNSELGKMVQYCPNNSGVIYGGWNNLGKVTAESKSAATQYYNSYSSIANTVSALNYGEEKCDDPCSGCDVTCIDCENSCIRCQENKEWLGRNYCYDKESLLNEVFGPDFAKEDTEGKVFYSDYEAIAYLEKTYDATFPDPEEGLVEGTEYIAVSVKKEVNYDLYSKYLKDVYIPFIYIDCDGCAYKNESADLKKAEIERIHDEIMNLVSTYQYYNNEDSIDGGISLDAPIDGGTEIVPGVSYSCSNGQPNLATYPGHGGVDINSVPVGTIIYPLFEGTVYSISRDNKNCYPQGDDTTGYTCSHCSGTGYGNLVVISGTAANGQKYYAYYAHLNDIYVNEGDIINLNTEIGTLGNTGCSTGPHLHLELRTEYGNKDTRVFATSIYNNESVAGVLCSRNVMEE